MKAILAVGVIAIVALTAVAVGQNIGEPVDVKIVAKKLADGRIEFGLEQDGERILPRTRFFPADAPVDKWLKSSAVAVAAPLPGDWELLCDTVVDEQLYDHEPENAVGWLARWAFRSVAGDLAAERFPYGIGWRCNYLAAYEAVYEFSLHEPNIPESERPVIDSLLHHSKEAAYADDYEHAQRIWAIHEERYGEDVIE